MNEVVRYIHTDTHTVLVSQNTRGQKVVGGPKEDRSPPDREEKQEPPTKKLSQIVLDRTRDVEHIRKVLEEVKALEFSVRYDVALQQVRQDISNAAFSKHMQYKWEEIDVPCILVPKERDEDQESGNGKEGGDDVKGDDDKESDDDKDSDDEINYENNIDFSDDEYGSRSHSFVMQTIELLLTYEEGESAKQVELNNSIQKLLAVPEFRESLNNLEVQGHPVAGLSSKERKVVVLAREKVTPYSQAP